MAKKILVTDIEPLVNDTKGNISIIAQRLGVSRATVYNRIKESTKLERAIHDARQTMIDNAESALYRAILEGNMTAIIFFLKTQAKDRGYIERQEHQVQGQIELNAADELHRRLSGIAARRRATEDTKGDSA